MKVTSGVVRATLAMIIGVVLLVFGVRSCVSTLDFLAHARPAVARVVGNSRNVDDRGNVSYCPLLFFHTASGRALTAQAPNICQDSPYARGGRMAIHYRADHPTTIEVDGFAGTWLSPLGLTALGLAFIAVPLLYLRAKWRAAHPRPATAGAISLAFVGETPWPAPEARPLGERYIEAVLARPPDAATALPAPVEPAYATSDAALRDASLDDDQLAAAPRDRMLALYRRGDYWAALDQLRQLAAPRHDERTSSQLGVLDTFPGLWFLPHSQSMYHVAGGVLASVLGDDEAVADEWQRAIELEPDYAPVHAALGDVYRLRGEMDAARQSYLRAVSLDPSLAPALYGLALLYHARRDGNKAREYLDRAVAAAPSNDQYRAARDSLFAGLSQR